MPDAADFIVVDHVSHRYAGGERDALSDVSLRVPRASTFGLLGPNGAGKSTLLSILTGVTPLQSGRITVAGRDLARDARAIKARSALVPQDFAFYMRLTARENLRFFAGAYGLTGAAAQRRIAQCAQVCRLEDVLDQPAKQYSGGLKRRLNLAIGLVSAPDVLYLDEPTVGIDAHSRECIVAAMRELQAAGMTLVYTSHYMEEVEALCDRVAVIDRGRILVDERVDRLLRTEANQVLQLSFAQPIAAAARTALLPWQPLFIDESHAQLSVAHAEVPRILQALATVGAPATRITYGVSRLHDVYLALLRESA